MPFERKKIRKKNRRNQVIMSHACRWDNRFSKNTGVPSWKTFLELSEIFPRRFRADINILVDRSSRQRDGGGGAVGEW